MNRSTAPYLVLGGTLAALATPALADQDRDNVLLVVSRIQYVADTTPGREPFPLIFNDPNVSGVQGNIFLDYIRPVPGAPARSVSLTASAAAQHQPDITTSFSSKSEGALMLSLDGRYLTYMGYNAVAGLEGVSNSETTNPAAQITGAKGPFYDRAVALIDAHGNVTVTPENFAFSGDNPRAVVTVDGTQFYMAGNADSTENKTTPVTGPGLSIGARLGAPGIGSSIQLGTYLAADRPDESTKQHIKDNNFRGIGIYRDTNGTPNLYVSKGSGGNGDDGIFQVEAGTVDGLPIGTGNTIIQLIGNQATNPSTNATSPLTPFGFFFANPTTLYVADEGNASIGTDTNGNPILISDPLAGLQKWSLVSGVWQLEYVLQDGLDLNVAQNLRGYPVPTYTTGLRNLTGHVNNDGTVTLYAVTAQTSAISGGEPDPTKLVAITDVLDATHLPTDQDHFHDDDQRQEHFVTLQQSRPGEVLRGVALAPAVTK